LPPMVDGLSGIHPFGGEVGPCWFGIVEVYILCRRKMGSNIGAIGVMVLCRSNDRGVLKYAFYASTTVRISMRRRDGK